MIIRAYKIEHIEYGPSRVNLYHDDRIVDWLGEIGATQTLNSSGTGMIIINKEDIEAAIRRSENTTDESERLEEEDMDTMKLMLEDCGTDDYVEYMCF